MMSSLMPSLKYSCSGSPLMLANGSTQIEWVLAVGGDGRRSAAAGARPVSSAMLSTTLRQAGALVSPRQSASRAHWIWSKGIGSGALSTASCTSLSPARARSASERTQCDFTASADQITRTTLAAPSCSSITSA